MSAVMIFMNVKQKQKFSFLKNIMIMKKILVILLTLLAISCENESGPGISSIDNPRADKAVSVYGEPVTIWKRFCVKQSN